jgi:hypothetical protein
MSRGAALRGLSPWSPAEGMRAGVVVAAGIIVLVIGWWRTADEASWAHQVTPVGIALSGFILAAFGAVSWLVRGRSAIVDRRAALLVVAEPAPVTADAVGHAADAAVVGHPSEGRFHRPGCVLVSGRGWSRLDRAALVAADRLPCGVCRP